MLMIFTAMGIAASTLGTRFRLYTIGTIILALGFGAWAVSEFRQIEQGLTTQWVGLKERIFWYGYQSWFIVLALTLLRGQRAARAEDGGLQAKERLSGSRSPFKTPEGEAAYLAAYEAAMKLWPVPYEEREIPTRFGMTHVVISGPKEAPPLVLLHGYMATLMMWAPNIADFSKEYRVYAVDVMGQPGRSVPAEPIRDRADFVAWLSATLDGLQLGRVSLAGMSFGGWIALGYAVAKPERVEKLVLLSVGGFLPMAKQFTVRGMLMVFWPTRLTVTPFMHWLGVKENPADPATHGMGNLVELTYLGLKYFRMPQETARIMPIVFTDGELRSVQMPTLVLFGDHEVICDPAAALARALRLIPDCRGELVPGPRHDMCASQHRLVDARVLDFLKKRRPENQKKPTPSAVA
jgi:pimeloyl-ACP methyl ester carboxylesterase